MARRSKREILDQARPAVETVIATLRQQEQAEQARAVQDVLNLAMDAARSATLRAAHSADRADRGDKAFALPVDIGLWQWARDEDNFENVAALSAHVVEGWDEFLAGRWVPEQPKRARRHSQPVKSNLNLFVPEDKLSQVEAAADRMVAERGWPTARGWKLNARQIAVQWLQRTYPAPDPDEEQQAAE